MKYTGDGIAISIGPIDIYWYAVFIVIGMFLAVYLAGREARRRGLNEETIYDLVLVVLPVGVIGARLWYVIFEWDRYAGDLMKILNFREGGLAIHGGLIFGVIAGLIYCRTKGLNPLLWADIIFMQVPLAQAIGRWGNFTNNEAHGGPTDLPWALDVGGELVHPTFLYESIGNFLIFLFLHWFARKKLKWNGQVIALYMILYGIIRFFIEGLRTDSLYVGPFRTAQLVSIIGIIAGIGMLMGLATTPTNAIQYRDPQAQNEE